LKAQAEGDNAITSQIIKAAIEVHRCLGPGLLESPYFVCLEPTMIRLVTPLAGRYSARVITP